MSLKQKTVSGLMWSFIDSLGGQGIQFIIGIILAKLLSPREFGLIGMIAILLAISQSLVDSGFGNALIRKKDCTQEDYSTVFFFNIGAGLMLYGILYFSAPAVSGFFHEPRLDSIVRVMGLLVVINSITLIQSTLRTKQIDFKMQARISILASAGSGILSIGMAYKGYGIWSLVAQQISRQTINSLLLWTVQKWTPTLVFSKKSFHELFGFGGKMLLSGLLDAAYRNIYSLIIGKYFSAQDLGYYTRALQFKDMAANNLNAIISRVSYPVLAKIQDDIPRLRDSYKMLVRSVMFITFILILGMAAAAKPMIVTLIGEKWLPSVIYLQLLCFAGMLYPLNALNLNILQVKGRSDVFLKLEIIKKALAAPVIIVGILWGIKAMITGMIVISIIACYVNSIWSDRLIGYPIKEQIKDILPSFILAAFMAMVVFMAGRMSPFQPAATLCMQIAVGALIVIACSETAKIKSYISIKNLAIEMIFLRNNRL